MGNETILYYVLEETVTGCQKSVKAHFWQKIKPSSFIIEKDEITVVTVMIPNINKGWKQERISCLQQGRGIPNNNKGWKQERISCPQQGRGIPNINRGWKPEKLYRLIQESVREYSEKSGGLSDAALIIQPVLQRLLQPDNTIQPENFVPALWKLADKLIEDNLINKKPESVFFLMGNSFFPEEQIQRFIEKIQPYLPYINQLTVIYGTDDEEEDASRFEDAIDTCMEMLYYEYGLVGRVCRKNPAQEKWVGMKVEKHSGFYLDYGYQGKLPYNIMRAGGVYIDLLSSEEKEQRIRKKCSKISYMSPMKYLDTIVKSGYDKLVNQA